MTLIPKNHEPLGDPCQWCGKRIAEHLEPIEIYYEIHAASGRSGKGTITTTWAALKLGITFTVGGQQMSDEKDEAQAKLAALDFKFGIYQYYKGGRYIVFAVSLHEETLQPLVHYYSFAKKTRWTRTLANFTEQIEAELTGDYVGPRFTFVREFREPGDIDPAIVVPWRSP